MGSVIFFQKAIVFIRFFSNFVASISTGRAEKLAIARLLGNRYNPNQEQALQKELEHGLSRMLAIRFEIEHLTGKEATELVRASAMHTKEGG